jgi:hypothetical protein
MRLNGYRHPSCAPARIAHCQQNVFIDAELELNFAGQRIRQQIQGDYSLHRETDNCPADGKFDISRKLI